MKSKKASVLIYGLMVALTIIILALALAGPTKEFTDSARNETSENAVGMNCSTTTSDFTKAACIATDVSLFYFIGGLIMLAGIFAGAKIIFS